LTKKHAYWTFAVSFLFSKVFIIYRTQFSHLCTKTDNQDVPKQGPISLWCVFHLLLIEWIQSHFWIRVHKHGLSHGANRNQIKIRLVFCAVTPCTLVCRFKPKMLFTS